MSTQSEAVLYHWDELPEDHPMDLISRRRITGTQMMVARVELGTGFRVPTHEHENEQIAVVLSGCVRFVIGAEGGGARRELIAASGSVVYLPSGIPHAAEALEDSVVLDMFSPPAERMGVDRA